MNFQHLSDQKILEALGERFKAVRLNRNLTVSALAEQAGLTGKTISNLEKGRKSVGLLNIIAVLRALGMLDELESFIPEPPPRAAAIIRREKTAGKTRQRASGKRVKRAVREKAREANEPWAWGEEVTEKTKEKKKNQGREET